MKEKSLARGASARALSRGGGGVLRQRGLCYAIELGSTVRIGDRTLNLINRWRFLKTAVVA